MRGTGGVIEIERLKEAAIGLTGDFELPLPAHIGDDERKGDLILAKPWDVSHNLFEVLYCLCEELLAHRSWDGDSDGPLSCTDLLLVHLNVFCSDCCCSSDN